MTLDGGATWNVLGGNLPSTFVQDLIVHPREDILVIGTHGRGVWAMDIRPIQQLTAEVAAEPLHLFDVEPVTLPSFGFGGGGGFGGGQVTYWMASAGEVEMVITDGDGNVVKTLAATGDAGLNAATWDLGSDRAGGQRRRFGPNLAGPGTYTVTVTSGANSADATIEIGR